MSNPDHYAIGTFTAADNTSFPALVMGKCVYPLATLPGLSEAVKQCPTTLALFEHWESALPQLNAAAAALEAGPSEAALDGSGLRTEAPVMPRQLVCAGANYYKHVVELIVDSIETGGDPNQSPEERRKSAEIIMDHRREHGQPFCFVKPVSTILAPFDDFSVPADSTTPDWELELAVVIGKSAHRVSRDRAMDYVAGYTIANDISSRDHLLRKDIPGMGMDWVAGKGKPGYCPLGPVIVPAQFVANPQDLWIEFKLNGEVMQSESTADMIFDVAQLIEFISAHMKLFPGDIISTGSPSGNGTHYNRFLTPGDVMEGAITGLGSQRNNCVAEQLAEDAVMHRPFTPLTPPN
ncbi:MAG: fumarylacetoacetate hydrolase family protein [Halieaceae bacterium]|nr:fumarylacetoacetate hydrolase family protein [Halieaceae bacterium]